METVGQGIDLSHAETETPRVDDWWREMSDNERRITVIPMIDAYGNGRVRLVAARANGHVILELTSPMPASERGPMLLAIEQAWNEVACPGLEVYLEPLQDRNRLRRLRGVQVATD